MEFINEPLLPWYLARHIEAARSRPCRRNDHCFAEQKNYDAVRKTAGYFRFGTAGEWAALAEVYRFLCPLYNYRMPLFHLITGEKQGDGQYRKVYEETPETPCERLLESPDADEEYKAELRRRRGVQNPVELNRSLNEAVGLLLKLNREKPYGKGHPVRRVLEPLRPDFNQVLFLGNRPFFGWINFEAMRAIDKFLRLVL